MADLYKNSAIISKTKFNRKKNSIRFEQYILNYASIENLNPNRHFLFHQKLKKKKQKKQQLIRSYRRTEKRLSVLRRA